MTPFNSPFTFRTNMKWMSTWIISMIFFREKLPSAPSCKNSQAMLFLGGIQTFKAK